MLMMGKRVGRRLIYCRFNLISQITIDRFQQISYVSWCLLLEMRIFQLDSKRPHKVCTELKQRDDFIM